jgi:hypothetical protein
MSLINDALKRAKQAQQKTSPPPTPRTPLRPVESPRPGNSGPGMWWLMAVVLLLVMVGGVIVWLVEARAGARQPVAQGMNGKPAAQVAVAPLPKPIPSETQLQLAPVASVPAVAPKSAPTPSPAGVPVVPAEVSLARDPLATTNVSAVVAETSPTLPKLQGIVYRPDRPSALLNGKTVLIGARSGEFLVVAITRQSVALVRAGQTNVLSLPE